MRRIFVAVAVVLVVAVSGCTGRDLSGGAAYYSSDERKNVMTEPYNKFAMRVQDAMQSGQLGETVAYVLPQQGYFPLMCVTGGKAAPTGYAGQVQVCTVDGKYMLSGVTASSPLFAEGNVSAVRANDMNGKRDSDGIISGGYKDGNGKIVTVRSVGTRAEIAGDDARLIEVFRSRPLK